MTHDKLKESITKKADSDTSKNILESLVKINKPIEFEVVSATTPKTTYIEDKGQQKELISIDVQLKILSEVFVSEIDMETDQVIKKPLQGEKIEMVVRPTSLENDIATINKRGPRSKIFWSLVSDTPTTIEVPADMVPEYAGHKFSAVVKSDVFGTNTFYILE